MPLSTPIIQLLDRDPIFLDVSQKVSDAIRLLTSPRFNHLPIVDGKKLVGMISSTDIIKLNATLLDKDDPVTVAFLDRQYGLEDVMEGNVITVSDRATIEDAAQSLSAGGFHGLPVVNADDELVGVITTTDLINYMLAAPPKPALAPAVERRLKKLEAVFSAAQQYVHSGLAEQEHSRLELALEAAREP